MNWFKKIVLKWVSEGDNLNSGDHKKAADNCMTMITSHPVFIRGIRPVETMYIIRGLRTKGLVQGNDFDFKYSYRSSGNEFSYSAWGATFYFKEERWAKWATFYVIKYA